MMSNSSKAPFIWCRILFWSQKWKNFKIGRRIVCNHPIFERRVNILWILLGKTTFWDFFFIFYVFSGIVSVVLWSTAIWNVEQPIKRIQYDVFYEKMYISNVPRTIFHFQLDLSLTLSKFISPLSVFVRFSKLNMV